MLLHTRTHTKIPRSSDPKVPGGGVTPGHPPPGLFDPSPRGGARFWGGKAVHPPPVKQYTLRLWGTQNGHFQEGEIGLVSRHRGRKPSPQGVPTVHPRTQAPPHPRVGKTEPGVEATGQGRGRRPQPRPCSCRAQCWPRPAACSRAARRHAARKRRMLYSASRTGSSLRGNVSK